MGGEMARYTAEGELNALDAVEIKLHSLCVRVFMLSTDVEEAHQLFTPIRALDWLQAAHGPRPSLVRAVWCRGA